MIKLDQLLYDKKLTRRQLSIESNIPYSCISDICNKKTDIKNITLENAIKLSKTLKIKVSNILTLQDEYDFDSFRSDIQHEIKASGQLSFLLNTLKNNRISELYKYNLKIEALYLTATVDYLSRINNISLTKKYDKYRKHKCKDIIYPKDILFTDEKNKEEAFNLSIPEFKSFNIVEVNFLDVV